MTQRVKPHPYAQFEGSALWGAIDKQIAKLAANGDLIEQTAREYIVGSICQALACADASK